MVNTLSTNSANNILSLLQNERSLREQAEVLNKEVETNGGFIKELLDQVRRNRLGPTGNPKLDAALALSVHTGSSTNVAQIQAIETIYAQLDCLESTIASWKEGGLMLVDLTSQVGSPTCLELAVLQVPPSSTLEITAAPGYFQDISVSVRIPGRLLAAWNSNTLLFISRHIDLQPKSYKFNRKDFRLDIVNMSLLAEPVTTSFDVTSLVHPNWGTRNVSLAGIFLGKEAIDSHIDAWRSVESSSHYHNFLDEFAAVVSSLAIAAS